MLNVGSAKQEGANLNGVWMATQYDTFTLNGLGLYTGPGRDVNMREERNDEYLMPGSPDYWTFDVSASYSIKQMDA